MYTTFERKHEKGIGQPWPTKPSIERNRKLTKGETE